MEEIVRTVEELELLHRALLELRYHPQPEDIAVSRSELTSALHQRVVGQLLTALSVEREEEADHFRASLDFAGQDRRRAIIETDLAGVPGWLDLSEDRKTQIAQHRVSPFLATASDIGALIEVADRAAPDSAAG